MYSVTLIWLPEICWLTMVSAVTVDWQSACVVSSTKRGLPFCRPSFLKSSPTPHAPNIESTEMPLISLAGEHKYRSCWKAKEQIKICCYYLYVYTTVLNCYYLYVYTTVLNCYYIYVCTVVLNCYLYVWRTVLNCYYLYAFMSASVLQAYNFLAFKPYWQNVLKLLL